MDATYRTRYGSAMIVTVKRGKGMIFCAGTAVWVHGLDGLDFYTRQITRNVLKKLSE